MFSLNFKNYNFSGRGKATFQFMVLTFSAILITVVICSFVDPFCEYFMLSYFLTLGLFLSIIISRKINPFGFNCYFLILIIYVIFVDFSGFFNQVINTLFYMLPISFSLLLLRCPISFVFSLSTLFILSIRIFLSTGLTSFEKILLIILVYVATYSVFFIRAWVIQLHKYKIDSLQKMHNSSIKILGKVAELKDEGTANHLDRVEIMVEMLCTCLKTEKKYRNYIDDRYIHDIRSAAYLHDIGKIGIPDKILGKKGSLTKKEFETIKSHTTIGYDILSDAKSEIEGESVYDLALEIARHHHEKWDGSGYPHGLSGEEIPFSARVMAIVDVYDALVSRRPYKVPFPHSKAIEIIREGSDTHFDPQIVDHFLDISEEIHMKISPFLK